MRVQFSSVVFEAVDVPCPGPFHFSLTADYVHDFCPLPNPHIGPSVLVRDVEHASFHFGLCGIDYSRDSHNDRM